MAAHPDDEDLDHDGLAAWVTAEMTRQSLQPKDIKEAGGPSWPTLNEILNAEPRRKTPAVLRSLSLALNHPPNTAWRILHRQPVESVAPSSEIAELRAELQALREAVADLQDRLPGEPGSAP